MLTTAIAALLLTASPADDLRVALTLKSPATIEPGAPIELDAALVNRSRRTTHRVVKAGDGSEMAWREPFVFYSAEADTGDGIWRPVPQLKGGRCGLYDHDWEKDVVDLKPGASLKIEWLPAAMWALDVPNSGRVRIRVHYAYRHRSTTRSGIDPMKSPMGSIAPFEIVSDPVEITLRPMVRAALKPTGRTAKVSRDVPLRDLFELTLHGTVNAPVRGGRLDIHWEVKGTHAGRRPTTLRQKRGRRGELPEQTIARGGRLTLIGTRNEQFFGTWSYPEAEQVLIRAVVTRTVDGQRSVAKSNWVPVTFE